MFVVRRPHYDTHIFHPAMRFVEPRQHLEDVLLPAVLMAMCEVGQSLNSCTKNDNSDITIQVDARNFLPEELDVKIVDNFIVVTGKHEEKQDDKGFVSRQFVRRYEIPKGVKAESVTCNLNSDGVLLISVPKAISMLPEKEIKVPISITGNTSEVTSKQEDISVTPQETETNSPANNATME